MATTLARLGVVGMAASMPISRAMFNVSAALMIVGWLLSGDWKGKFELIRDSPAAVACLAFFAVGAFSLGWVDTLGADQWKQLRDYSRLLYVPMIMTLIRTEAWQRRAWTALIGGMLIVLAVYLLDIWFEVPWTGTYGANSSGQGVFYHHISQGMVLSFLGAYALHRGIEGQGWQFARLFWIGAALATLAGLIVVGQSRTGQLSVLLAYFILAITHLPRRKKLSGLLLALLAAGLMLLNSTHMQERFTLAFEEFSSFQQDGERTSVGARLKAWEFSADLIEQAPWLGHGIGSYQSLAFQHFAGSPICSLGVCDQPHNQFILTAVESGALGLVAWIALLLTPMLKRDRQQPLSSQLVAPFLAIVAVTSFFDSTLQIQGQCFFTVTTLGLLMASRRTRRAAIVLPIQELGRLSGNHLKSEDPAEIAKVQPPHIPCLLRK